MQYIDVAETIGHRTPQPSEKTGHEKLCANIQLFVVGCSRVARRSIVYSLALLNTP